MSPAVEASLPPPAAAPQARPAGPTPGGTGGLRRVAGWSFVLFAIALPVAIAPMYLAGALCGALTLAAWLARPGPHRLRTPLDVPAFLWLGAMGLATLLSLDPAASAPGLRKGLIPLVTGVAAWHVADRRRGVAAVTALLVAGSVVSLIGVGRFIAAGGHFPARAIGFTGYWMTFSYSLLLLASLACGIAIAGRRPAARLAALAAALACAPGLVTSFTRSAWIGLAASLALMLGLRRPRGLVVLAALALVAYVALPGQFGDRLRSAFDPRHPGNLERTYMWDAGVRVFRDHPVTGVGLQNLTSLLRRYRSPLAAEDAAHVHSEVLQVAVSTGTVGLAAFLLLWVALFRTTAPGPPDPKRARGLAAGVRLGVTGGLAGFLIAALFDHPFGDEQLLFLLFTLAGIAWAARGWDDPAAGSVRPSAPIERGRGPAAA